MAFSDDDIKINVTLDTNEAQIALKQFKTQFDDIFKRYKSTFKSLSAAAKEFSKIERQRIKTDGELEKKRLDTETRLNELTQKQKTKRLEAYYRRKNTLSKISDNEEKRLLDDELKRFQEAEKNKRAELKATTDKAIQESKRQLVRTQVAGGVQIARIRARGRSPELSPEDPKNAAGGFDILTGSLGKAFGGLARVQAQFFVLKQAIQAVVGPLVELNQAIDQTAREANEIEGLRTGFETLQRSIGNLPEQSIKDLREATQGLISDTDLYQRANQAVLLNVPTDTFNEAAAAAVKLGRAMGVDAAFGLESLSIGLGRQSRLYLDNLGIVVSAQEAYQNFGLEVGKTADQLSDSEKRAAFFAEALGKIKERAEELPDLLDTVGIAQEKLVVAQKNANQAFLEGFNASDDLTIAYKLLAEQVKLGEQLNFGLGKVAARASADVKILTAGFELLKNAGKAFVLSFAEIFNQLILGESLLDTPIELLTKRLENQRQALQKSRDELQRYIEKREDFAKAGASDLGNSIYARSIEETTRKIEKQREEIAKLQNDLEKLNALSVKPTIDLDELRAARQDVQNAFTGFSEQAAQEEELNVIPGLDASQTQELVSRVASIRAEFAKTKDISAFNNALKDVEIEVSNLLAGGKLEKLDQALQNATSQEEIDKIKANILAVAQASREQAVATEEGAKAVQVLISKVGRVYREQVNEEKKASQKRRQQQKQEERDSENFFKRIRAASKDAIPREVEERIANLFQNNALGSEPFIRDLEQLRQQFIDSGQEVEIFDQRILKLVEQFNQGIPIKTGIPELNKELKTTAEELEELKSQSFNIRDTIFGESKEGEGGAFFGFDVEGVSAEIEAAVAKAIGEIAKIASTLVFESFNSSDAPEIGRQIGQAIGGDIGGIVGEAVGRAVTDLTKDLAGTTERKKIDAFFFDLFNFERLTILIDDGFDELTGQIKRRLERITDLTFEGGTLFGGDVQFGGDRFFDFFNTLDAKVQNSFLAFGTSFGLANGIAEEQSRLIGVAILNNIGGSLQDLQILIQATGAEFEQLAQSLLNLFLDAKLTIEEYYQQALALQQLFETGIPGAIGAVDQALSNLQASLADGRPGRYAVDSLRDVAAEGQEVSRSFQDVIAELAASYGATAQQTELFFAALQAAGITSLEQLKTAGENTIISLLFAFQQIRDQAVTTAEEVGSIAVIPEIRPSEASSSRRSSGPDPAEERRRALEALRQETYRLLIASKDYANILKQINSLELTNIQGGREIRQLREEIFKTLRRVNNLEEKYQKELDKGARASEKRLSRLGRALDEARKKLADLTETADESTDSTKQLDLSGIIPLIRDANKLSVVTQQAGVDLNKNIDILIKGFLQGRLSISEVNAEIEKTRELLGPGIPNAVGAVTDAFQNLIDAGEQGGAFSVDAFTDIFAEFREKFEKEGSALREAQRQQLVANLEQAKQAFAQAVGPEATAEARKSLDLAKKALSDFYDEIPAPDLEDLRSQLQSAFSPEQVDLFFRALDESGLKTFDDFEKAGADSVIGILGRLKELGFQFNETSDDIVGINDGLIDAEKNANGGLDPLAEAIELVKQFNEGASTLPPVFNSTTEAIGNMQGPLQQLSDGFDNIIEKLSLLSGQTFENNVVFNVRTVGDSNSQTLIDILFGDGGSTGGDVGGEGPGVGSDTRKLEKFRKELQKLKSSGRGKSRRADILRRRIRLLTGGGNSL